MKQFLILPIGICLLCASLVLSSCSKDYDYFYPDPSLTDTIYHGDAGRLMDSLAKVLLNPESFQFDNGEDVMIALENGAVLSIPAYSFQNSQGQAVFNNIQLEATLMQEPGQWMARILESSNTGGKLLSTRFVIQLKARKNGEALSLAPQKRITCHVPEAQNQLESELFYGKELADHSIRWEDADADPELLNPMSYDSWSFSISGSNVQGTGYVFTIDRLGYFSCSAYLPGFPVSTSLCIGLPEEFEAQETRVYAIFNEGKSALLLPFLKETGKWCSDHVPANQNLQIMVLSEQGIKRYFLSTVSANIPGKTTIDLDPARKDLDQIAGVLKDL